MTQYTFKNLKFIHSSPNWNFYKYTPTLAQGPLRATYYWGDKMDTSLLSEIELGLCGSVFALNPFLLLILQIQVEDDI